MEKFHFALASFLLIAIIACNNAGNKAEKSSDDQEALADSLQKEVIEGHNIGMTKTRWITKAKQEAERLIDSIGKLPVKAREAAKPYKSKLESLVKDLDNAHLAMDNWMEGFKLDSAKDNIEQRIKYLTEEKMKVSKVKDAILGSLQKADSLIKTKF